ncbi:MAG: hypothetical protein AAF552_13580 [Pseudomonadota bacterium]
MLAPLIDRSRVSAILTLALGLVVAALLPLGLVLAGAVAAFVALRKGITEGLLVSAGGLILLAVMTAAAGYPPGNGMLLPAAFLGAALVSAWTLDTGRSLTLSVWTMAALALLALLLFWLAVESPEQFWRALFDEVVQAAAESGQSDLAAQLGAMAEALQWRGVTGQFFGSLFLLLTLSLFWGRSWQARLVNPEGFRQEFQALTLGKPLALGSAAAFMLAAALGLDLPLSIAAVLLYVWLVPAFALIHWLVARAGLGTAWLWAAYVLCVLTWGGNNTLFLLFPLAAMLNEYLDFRRRGSSEAGGE